MTTAASSKTSRKQSGKKPQPGGASSPLNPTEKLSGASTPRPLSALKANPKNPRLPFTDAQTEAFKRSLAEYGDLSGIVENQRTGQLVGGHKRVEQFTQDKQAQVHLYQQYEKPDATGTLAFGFVNANGTNFAYRLVDWPVEKEKAANLAANQFGAEFDWLEVQNMLKELDGQVDLSLTGFSEMELKQIQYAGSTEENDPQAEWKGMPQLSQDGVLENAFTCIVRFKSENDRAEFEKFLGWKLSHKGNSFSTWFPKPNFDQLGSNDGIAYVES